MIQTDERSFIMLFYRSLDGRKKGEKTLNKGTSKKEEKNKKSRPSFKLHLFKFIKRDKRLWHTNRGAFIIKAYLSTHDHPSQKKK